MRRTLRVLISALAVGVAALLVTSCGGGGAASASGKGGRDSTSTRRARRAADTLAAKAGKAGRAAKSGLASARGAKGKRGSLKGMTPEEKAMERKQAREEKKRLRAEIRRKRREERLAMRAGRALRGRNTGRKSAKRGAYDPYTLKGTIAGTYALVGSRRLQVGDVIAGKRLVEVGSDRIVVEQFGSRMSVRIGEPV